MKIFEVKSGQQAGNLKADIVIWSKNPNIAKTMLGAMQVYARDNWVWGPNLYTHDSKEVYSKELMTSSPEVTSANLNDWLEL